MIKTLNKLGIEVALIKKGLNEKLIANIILNSEKLDALALR